MTPLTTLSLVIPLVFSQSPDDSASAGASTDSRAPEVEGFVFDRGEDFPALVFPRREVLQYRAVLSIAFVETAIGTVTQTCEVIPYQRSVLLPSARPGEEDLEAVQLQIHAKGYHSLYSLDSRIETRILPQEWPRITHREISEGSEKKRTETKIGVKDGAHTASFRCDTDRGAPPGTRIWDVPQARDVPAGTNDMLSAGFFARILIRDGLQTMSFPVYQKWNVWAIKATRGREKRIETRAGTFDVVEIAIEAEPCEGESIDEGRRKRFQGLFGLEDGFRLWAEKRTGVPVAVTGRVPIGPISIGVDITLEGHEGTPNGFAPVE